MGGGHGGHGVTYKGITLHAPKRWHVITGKGMCALMWVGDILGKDMGIMATVMNMRNPIDLAKRPKELGDATMSSYGSLSWL
ncbi:NADH dehydrogenase [ubiquinone] 1 beta subcomplex subunit 2-like protein [Drosera capensis]